MGTLARRAGHRRVTWLGIGALLTGAAVGASTLPLSTAAAVAVAAPVLVVFATVLVARPRARVDRPRPGRRTAVAWAGLLCIAAAWELTAWLQQPAYDVASADHPTASVLLDPITDALPTRFAAWGLWLYLGYRLVRRRPCAR